jgi:hypothetical protein
MGIAGITGNNVANIKSIAKKRPNFFFIAFPP